MCAKRKGCDAMRPQMDGEPPLKIGFIAHMLHSLVVSKQTYGVLV